MEKFIITLSPVCAPEQDSSVYEPLSLHINGSVLTLNGIEYDFSGLNDGDFLPSKAIENAYFVGDVYKEGSTVSLVLVQPHGYDAPNEAKFPEPILVTEDGPVTLPDACWPPKEPEYPEEPQPEPEDDSEER